MAQKRKNIKQTSKKRKKSAETAETAKREVKDGLFKIIFSILANAAALYSALHNEPCRPKDIQIFTIETVISGKRRNDLAIVAKGRIIALFEHMSSAYTNMPFRFLIYLGLLYEKWLTAQNDEKKIYSSKLYKIPSPEFVVLYNGKTNRPERETLRLSDSFEDVGQTLGSLELDVEVYNINKGMNEELLSKCRPLREYSEFVAKLRELEDIHEDYTTAVRETIKHCIDNNILADILREHGGTIMSILFDERVPEWEAQAMFDDAVEEAVEEAVKETRKETRKETWEEAKEYFNSKIGDKAIEIAKNFLQLNVPATDIANATGLTLAEVETLRNA
ncbi:MAG: hypothetical protein FWG68_02550 [Defluviitaleaceae bacterium]|nr:hypothetical protein [Defluviitaleaceae bacterium]